VGGLDSCAEPTIEEREKIAPSRFLSLPPSSVSAAHRFGSDWSKADMAGPAAGSAQSRMTHRDHLLRDFGAAQHVKRAAIPTYKCSINYSITSWAVARYSRGRRLAFPIAADVVSH
jgi:hypothetical protein